MTSTPMGVGARKRFQSGTVQAGGDHARSMATRVRALAVSLRPQDRSLRERLVNPDDGNTCRHHGRQEPVGSWQTRQWWSRIGKPTYSQVPPAVDGLGPEPTRAAG